MAQQAFPTQPVGARSAGTLRGGQGEPLVLLHGVTGSAQMWRSVVPLLAPHHDVIALTALGHRGGAAATQRPTRIADVVDETERRIDALGFERVHLAGNSLGGWVALELARRGRASSVCALSPAGAWAPAERHRSARMLMAAVSGARSARALLPLLSRSASFRRWALRDSAAHGERVSRAELLDLIADMLGCEVCDDLLRTSEQLAPLSPGCPVTLAWSGLDRIFPVAINGARARELVQGARFMVLEGVGHVPMLDDPQLVAETILESTGARVRCTADLRSCAE